MSYTIEYNRQFIRTSYGYIPCWLAGDNNVWTGSGRYDKRVRDWSVFHNWVNVSEEEMIETMKKYFNDYNQHWKRNSKWVTNDGLISWIKSGCRNSATIEEILQINRYLYNGVHCYVVVYDMDDRRNVIMDTYIKTNLEMDRWSLAVSSFQKNNMENKEYRSIYPSVDFVIEELKHPVRNKEIVTGKEYILKYKRGYVTDFKNGGLSYCSNLKSAKVFSYEDLEELRENSEVKKYLEECKILDAALKGRKQYMLYIDTGRNSYYSYVSKGRGKFYLNASPITSKKYFSYKEAEKDCELIQSRLTSGTVKIVEFDDLKI